MASTSSSRARPSSSSSSLKTFVDTHAHMDAVLQKLDIERVDEYFAAVEREEESESAGARLEACITIGCSERSFESAAALSREDSRVYSAFGVHPLSAREWPNAEARVRELARNEPRCVAIGECGLDYHRIPEDEDVEAYKQRQRDAFVAQIKLADELEKPLVVHTREAEDDTLAIMKAHLRADAPVHVHCFTSSANLARALLDAFPGLCLGFTGVVTFKNGGDVREVVAGVPLDRILLETDAPYMAPTPFRGQTCHPGMVPRIAAAVARVHDVPVERVFDACRANTRRIYGI